MLPSPVLIFHIAMGLTGLASGAFAVILRKGSRWHRLTGDVFVVAMVGMGVAGSYLAVAISHGVSVVVAALAAYLAVTGWLTARRHNGGFGRGEIASLVFAGSLMAAALTCGVLALHAPGGQVYNFPAPPYFLFGAVTGLAAALDVGVLVRRGVSGGQRIARHLWRMCFSLFLACLSFFIGQEDIFPAAVRSTQILKLPVILTLGVMVFWLLRVFLSRKWKAWPVTDAVGND